MSSLQSRLLNAHALDDIEELVSLYTEAADTAAKEDARGFYLTHAYIYALEAGLNTAEDLRRRLIAMGRETPL